MRERIFDGLAQVRRRQLGHRVAWGAVLGLLVSALAGIGLGVRHALATVPVPPAEAWAILQEEGLGVVEGRRRGCTVGISGLALPLGENGPSGRLVRASRGAFDGAAVDVDRGVPDVAALPEVHGGASFIPKRSAT